MTHGGLGGARGDASFAEIGGEDMAKGVEVDHSIAVVHFGNIGGARSRSSILSRSRGTLNSGVLAVCHRLDAGNSVRFGRQGLRYRDRGHNRDSRLRNIDRDSRRQTAVDEDWRRP